MNEKIFNKQTRSKGNAFYEMVGSSQNKSLAKKTKIAPKTKIAQSKKVDLPKFSCVSIIYNIFNFLIFLLFNMIHVFNFYNLRIKTYDVTLSCIFPFKICHLKI